jgi:hypothetical protein
MNCIILYNLALKALQNSIIGSLKFRNNQSMKNLRYNFQSYSVGVGSAAAKNKLLAHLVLATSLKEHQISA